MKLYNGLPKERVLEIHSFVIEKRKKLGIGQRKLFKLVKEKFGVEIKENTISGWIFRKMAPYGNEGTQFKAKPKPKMEEIYELYTNQKQSAEKLGRQFGVSTIIFINWLKYYGIPTRTHLESMNTEKVKEELRERKLKRPTKEYSVLSPEKAYILGVLCGDACLTKWMVRLEIRRDEEFIKKFVDCFEKVYGLKYGYKYYKPKNSLVTQINSVLISEDLSKYGKFKTREWNVPNEIMESKDEKIIGSFLRGFYDSEGSVSRPSITASSINWVGLNGIALLLKRMGLESTLRPQQNGRYYVLYIFRKGRFMIFKNKIGFTIKRKSDKIKETLNTGFFSKRSVAI